MGIDGESAGAMSVALHLTNTSSKIIKGAIMESCVNGGKPYPTPESWGNLPMTFEKSLGCNSMNNSKQLECILNVNSDMIVEQQQNKIYTWFPTMKSMDGLFSDQPTALYQQGKTLNVPFIIGNNEKELSCGNSPVSYLELQNGLQNMLGDENANQVLTFYNVSSICGDAGGNCVNVSCEIYTDLRVKCISRNMTASSAKMHVETKYYVYQFNHGSSFNPELYSNDYCWATPCHTAELWYVFYSPDAMNEQLNITFESYESVLAHQIDSYWTNFAQKPFDPNMKRNVGQNIIEWLPFSDDDREVMVLDVDKKYRVVKNYETDVCQFWDSLGWPWLM